MSWTIARGICATYMQWAQLIACCMLHVCTWHTTIFTQCTHSVHMVKVLHIFYMCALCEYDMHNIYAAELQLAHMCATCIQDFCKGLFSVDLSCSEEPIMVTFQDMRYTLSSMQEHIVPLTIKPPDPQSTSLHIYVNMYIYN